MKNISATMTAEMSAFVYKFNCLLLAGFKAKLVMECDDGAVRAHVETLLGPAGTVHAPAGRHHPHRGRCRAGPARHRRRARRTEANAAGGQQADLDGDHPPDRAGPGTQRPPAARAGNLPEQAAERNPNHPLYHAGKAVPPNPPHEAEEVLHQPPHQAAEGAPCFPPHYAADDAPHPHLPHQAETGPAGESFPPPSHSHSKEVFPQSAAPLLAYLTPLPCPQSTTKPPPCTLSTTKPPPCPQSTTMPPPCTKSTSMPPPCTQITTTPPPCPLSATRPSDQADSPAPQLSPVWPPHNHPELHPHSVEEAVHHPPHHEVHPRHGHVRAGHPPPLGYERIMPHPSPRCIIVPPPSAQSQSDSVHSPSPQSDVVPSSSPQSDAVPSSSPQSDGVPSSSPQSDGVPSSSPQSDAVPSSSPQSDAVPSSSPQSDGVPSSSPQSDAVPSPSLQSDAVPSPSPQCAIPPNLVDPPAQACHPPGGQEICSFSFHALGVPNPPTPHPHSSRRAYLLSDSHARAKHRTLMKPVMKWRPTDMNNIERACKRRAPWDKTLILGIMGIEFELCDVIW